MAHKGGVVVDGYREERQFHQQSSYHKMDSRSYQNGHLPSSDSYDERVTTPSSHNGTYSIESTPEQTRRTVRPTSQRSHKLENKRPDRSLSPSRNHRPQGRSSSLHSTKSLNQPRNENQALFNHNQNSHSQQNIRRQRSFKDNSRTSSSRDGRSTKRPMKDMNHNDVVQYFTPQAPRKSNGRRKRRERNHSYSEEQQSYSNRSHRKDEEIERSFRELQRNGLVENQVKTGQSRSHSPAHSIDNSLIWDPYYDENDTDSESKQSEALVESCLRDLEGRELLKDQKKTYETKKNEMYDSRVATNKTSSSSYNYSHQSSNSYSNQNGAQRYNSSHQTSYEYNNNNEDPNNVSLGYDPNISLGSLRSHDIMEPEDRYDFGVVRNTSGSRIPSRAGSIRSNRSSMRNGGDPMEEYDIITPDQVQSSSRRSSLSHVSDAPPSYNSYKASQYDNQSNRGYSGDYSTQSQQHQQQSYTNEYSNNASQQRYSGGEYNNNSRRNSSSSNTGMRRSQSVPRRSNSLPRNAYIRKEQQQQQYQQDLHQTSTMPRQSRRPPSACASEPPAEAVVEEERVNADGSTVLIRRRVTATTTHYHENEAPKVEVHISPATETIISPPTSPKHVVDISQQQNYDMSATAATTTMTSTNQEFINENYVDNHFDDGASFTGSQQPYYGDPDAILQQQHPPAVDIHNTSSQQNSSNTYITNTYITNTQNAQNTLPRPSSKASSRSHNRSYANEDDLHNRSYVNDDNLQNRSFNNLQNSSYVYEQHTTNVNNTDQMNINNGGYGNDDVYSVDGSTLGRKAGGGGYMKTQSEQVVDIKQSGSVSLLDLLMFLKTDDTALKSNAAGYIMHVSYNDEKIKREIRELDIIPPLVKLLDHENFDCHRNAAGALKNLSYGKFVDDNKLAIRDCSGVATCTRLLYSTASIEVKEHVTGILWNISSEELESRLVIGDDIQEKVNSQVVDVKVQTIKRDLMEETLEAVSVLLVIPLSGWEKEEAEMGAKPGLISWSVLLRNSTGVLRNISSCGLEARQKMRAIEGLVDSLVWILRAAIASDDRDEINKKIIENVMCTLRNLSYKVDKEIDRNVHLDASKVPHKNNNEGTGDDNNKKSRDKNKDDSTAASDPNTTTEYVKQNGRYGCVHMKKKAYVKQKNKSRKGSMPLTKDGNKKPPPEQWKYLVPVRENRPTPLGVELLWQQDTVTCYIYLLTNCENPVTLEASAAAIHNLCGCEWNWSGLLRVHVRLQKGIPPMHDLLSVDQEYVVRSVAYALRNLAIDRTNKWSIGKYAHDGLMQLIPPVKSYDIDKKPSEFTIHAVLSCLQVLVYKDGWNAKYVKDDGLSKLVALTREPSSQNNSEKPLRVYSEKILVETNRLLMYLWEQKENRDILKDLGWSYSKAQDQEKSFNNKEKKKKQPTESYAEMEPEEAAIMMERDTRRYINVDNSQDNNSQNNSKTNEEHEMTDFGHRDVSAADEDEPLVRRNTKEKKKKNNSWFTKKDKKDEHKNKEETDGGEETKLVNGEKDTSF